MSSLSIYSQFVPLFFVVVVVGEHHINPMCNVAYSRFCKRKIDRDMKLEKFSLSLSPARTHIGYKFTLIRYIVLRAQRRKNNMKVNMINFVTRLLSLYQTLLKVEQIEVNCCYTHISDTESE